nr:hypothetical protein [Corynebacterium ulcerans]
MSELAPLWWLIALQGVLTVTALFYAAQLGDRDTTDEQIPTGVDASAL